MLRVLRKNTLNILFYVAIVSTLIVLTIVYFNSMNWVSISGLILIIIGISITSFSSLLIDYLDEKNESTKH
jgi:ABC-type Fe3+-siderophore transport system permease subunit